MPLAPRVFDPDLRRLRLERAASGFEAADFLHQRAAADVVERLEAIMRRFPLAVDLAARRGAFAHALAVSDARRRVETLFEMETSPAMLAGRRGCFLLGDAEALPFAPGSLDLIVSVLALHWTNDVVGALVQTRRALKPDGLFLAAFLGGATLHELRGSLLAAEAELTGGAAQRVSPFADPADAPGLLQRAGFLMPVVDVDRVTVRYADPLGLLADLRRMGETAAFADRPPKLRRAVIARARELYIEQFAEADGRVPATFEILTLTGWAAS